MPSGESAQGPFTEAQTAWVSLLLSAFQVKLHMVLVGLKFPGGLRVSISKRESISLKALSHAGHVSLQVLKQ